VPRAPWHIKLADFGLSKASDSLYTFCGTAHYIAPEIVALQGRSKRRSYTAAVDVWSLGVVILEYGYGLPNYPVTAPGTLPLGWPDMLVRAVDAWDPDGFDVLYSMLVLDPQRRASASACLQQIRSDRVLRAVWTAVNDETHRWSRYVYC
jgi:serine/threonine-protein kinase Chk2